MAISESIRHELSAVFDARVEVDCFCRLFLRAIGLTNTTLSRLLRLLRMF